MKRIARWTATAVLSASLSICAAAAAKDSPITHAPNMSAAQARQAVLAAAAWIAAPIRPGAYQKVNAESLHISRDGLVFNNHYDDQASKDQHVYTVAFARFTSVSCGCMKDDCNIASDPSGTLGHNELGEPFRDFEILDLGGHCPASCHILAQDFATALNSLHAIAVARQNAAGEYHRQATGWRALTPKPPLPEEVRVHRILAENAVKEKKLDDALEHYEAGLDLYYTWPQGHFNAALIAAEIGFYEQAVEHMQSYLELVPDAPDAEAARDQIVIWRDKAGG
jgi:tetratricopeptide (TPR) repeat protein